MTGPHFYNPTDPPSKAVFLRAGVIGLGFMGRTHIKSLRSLGIEIAGVLGEDTEEAEQASQALGGLPIYSNLKEILSDPHVGVVHICTPNHLHYPMAKAILLAGKNVICEKPLALNNIETSELMDLSNRLKLTAAVNYNLRYYPLVQDARARIRSGEVGEIHLVHGGYLQDWLCLPTDWNWRLDPEQGGSLRVVADIGTHWLDMVTWMTGLEVKAVMADLATFLPQRLKPRHAVETFAGKIKQFSESEEVSIRTEDAACLLLKFSNGARGTLILSQVSAGRKNRLWWEINGSRASLCWNQENPNQLWFGHRDLPNQVAIKDPALMHPEARSFADFPGGHTEGYPETFVQLFRQVYTAIRDGGDKQGDYPSFSDGHRQMTLCNAIQKSAVDKCWVEV